MDTTAENPKTPLSEYDFQDRVFDCLQQLKHDIFVLHQANFANYVNVEFQLGVLQEKLNREPPLSLRDPPPPAEPDVCL